VATRSLWCSSCRTTRIPSVACDSLSIRASCRAASAGLWSTARVFPSVIDEQQLHAYISPARHRRRCDAASTRNAGTARNAPGTFGAEIALIDNAGAEATGTCGLAAASSDSAAAALLEARREPIDPAVLSPPAPEDGSACSTTKFWARLGWARLGSHAREGAALDRPSRDPPPHRARLRPDAARAAVERESGSGWPACRVCSAVRGRRSRAPQTRAGKRETRRRGYAGRLARAALPPR
jgi:hypothetical protein